MKGLFGGLLAAYEFLGFIARTFFLFIAKLLFLLVGTFILILIGRKDLLNYAKAFYPENIPDGLQETFDDFFLSESDRKEGKKTDERLIKGIFMSLWIGVAFSTTLIVLFFEEFNLIGGILAFLLMAGITALAAQIPHGLLHSLRVTLEKKDAEKKR